jgi:very-short-patch-repair endonuclease
MLDKIIKSELGLEVVKEYKFHPLRKWRFDYAIIELKIAVEQEGAIWTNGRHTRPAGFINDMEKYNTATALGWKVIRIATGDYSSALKYITMIQSQSTPGPK